MPRGRVKTVLNQNYDAMLIDQWKKEMEAEDLISSATDFSDNEEISRKWNYFSMFNKTAVERISPSVNDSFWICYVGKRGSGKSTLSIVQYFAICKELGIEPLGENLCFSSGEIIKAIKNENTKRTVLVLEELGVSAYSRNFMTQSNKELNQIMQMFRYKNVVLISNFQALTHVDNHIRSQLDVLFWCRSKTYRTSGGNPYARKMVKPYDVSSSPFSIPIIKPVKILSEDKNEMNEEPIGWIPVPTENELFKKYGVTNSWMSEYHKRKNEYFVSLGEEQNEAGENETGLSKPTKRQEKKNEHQSDVIKKLVDELASVTGKSQVQICKDINENRNLIVSWMNEVKEISA
jgi:hypothetical protein